MTFESPFVFDTEDNFDDSYAQKQDNDSIYDGNKDLYIFEVNNSSFFKDFYWKVFFTHVSSTFFLHTDQFYAWKNLYTLQSFS